MNEDRSCTHCGAPLLRGWAEKSYDFARRKFCPGRVCLSRFLAKHNAKSVDVLGVVMTINELAEMLAIPSATISQRVRSRRPLLRKLGQSRRSK